MLWDNLFDDEATVQVSEGVHPQVFYLASTLGESFIISTFLASVLAYMFHTFALSCLFQVFVLACLF